MNLWTKIECMVSLENVLTGHCWWIKIWKRCHKKLEIAPTRENAITVWTKTWVATSALVIGSHQICIPASRSVSLHLKKLTLPSVICNQMCHKEILILKDLVSSIFLVRHCLVCWAAFWSSHLGAGSNVSICYLSSPASRALLRDRKSHILTATLSPQNWVSINSP